MKAKLSTGAVALTLFLSGCSGEESGNLNAAAANDAAPLTQIAAPNNGDWTQVVSETPEGGYRMGNPDAPVKLIEYASITCPHCAVFAEDATQPLENVFVRSGQVSYEYRPFLLFPSDPAIFMLLRCQGPTPFFRLVEQLYATQPEWSARLQTLSPERAQQIQNMTPTAQAAAIIEVTELAPFFRQRGMPESRINSCLADTSQLERLAEITRHGSQENNVTGTPTFLINGEKADVAEWPELERRLRAAIDG
jgi:protein-disulfide isomerase